MQQISKNSDKYVQVVFEQLMASCEYEIVPCDMSVDRPMIEELGNLAGSGCSDIKFYENYITRGISAREGQGVTYRTFISLSDGRLKVKESLYVSPYKKDKKTLISARIFSQDNSLSVINAKTEGKGIRIQELFLFIYDSKEVEKYCRKFPNSNPCEIGENFNEHIHPSKILILLSPSTPISETLLEYLGDKKELSEVLILITSKKMNGEIPYEFALNPEVLISMFDQEKRKELF